MENPDRSALLRQIDGLEGILRPLHDAAWPQPGQRSAELTPLYVQRYVGPRTRNPLSHHAHWELTYTFRGHGQLIGTDRQALAPHTALLVPTRLDHAESSRDTLDTLWIGLHGSLLAAWPTDAVTGVEEPALDPLMERLWVLARLPQHKPGLALDGLLRQILARLHPSPQPATAEPAGWPQRLLQYVHEHLHEPLNVARLAAAMDCSEGHLHRRFKRAFGQTPTRWLTRQRIERAVDLMSHSSLSIKQIAHRVGFRDPLYFSRVFRQVRGEPPSVVMQRARP